MEMGAAAFRAFFRHSLGHYHLFALITIVGRDPVSPPELSGDTPVTDSLKPVEIRLSEAFRYKFKLSAL